jgi:hypothetical protein
MTAATLQRFTILYYLTPKFMTHQEHTHRLQYLDQLIWQRATGSSSALASRLNVCRTTVANDLDCLRQLGGDIGYCRVRRTYYYRDSRRLFIGFVPESSVATWARSSGGATE